MVTRFALSLLLVAVSTAAQHAGSTVPTVPSAMAPRTMTRLLIDAPAADTVHVLAPTYKAEFTRAGVTFTPYFGARAPRNFPVAMRLEGIRRGAMDVAIRDDAAPRVEGDRVVYERGSVREVWALRTDEVEQAFVFAAVAGTAAGGGDLVIRVGVATDLECADVEDGLAFVHQALGRVLYGDVVTFAATGGQVRTPSTWREGRIELTVPAAFLAVAQGEVTVDPVVRALPIDTGSENNRNADLAYDRQNDRYLVVYERVFSGLDADIIGRGFDGEGNFINERLLAGGSIDARNPSVGNNDEAHLFLVAWDEPFGTGRAILGRRETGALNVGAPAFAVRAIAGANCSRPAVGGSVAADSAANLFAIVCEQGAAIALVKVTTAEVITAAGVVTDPRVTSRSPAITEARATNAPWVIAYLENATGGSELKALAVPGTSTPVVGLALAGVDTHGRPSVAGDGTDFLVVNSRPTRVSGDDVFAVHLRANGTALQIVATHDLTTREPGVQLALHQRDPVVSHDGCRFVYAYLEDATSFDDVFAATILLGSGSPTYHAGHEQLITGSARQETNPVLASSGEMGGPRGRHLFVCDQIVGTGDTDLVGAIYNGTTSGIGVRTVSTACPPLSDDLQVSGVPALGNTVRVTLRVPVAATPVLMVGFEIPPVILCGTFCRLGVSPVLTLVASAFDIPVPCDPNFLGAQLAIQGVAVNAIGGCAPPATPLPLTVTKTTVLTVQ